MGGAMTALVLLLALIALVAAIGAARQATRTLRAWQIALESIHVELGGRKAPAPERASDCPCTCHPLPSARRHS